MKRFAAIVVCLVGLSLATVTGSLAQQEEPIRTRQKARTAQTERILAAHLEALTEILENEYAAVSNKNVAPLQKELAKIRVKVLLGIYEELYKERQRIRFTFEL